MTSEPSEGRLAAEVTARELEILTYVGRRFGNAEIAEVLSLSKRTVESHVSSLYRKLGVTERGDLVRAGARAGAARRLPLGVATYGVPSAAEPLPVATSRAARAAAVRVRARATLHRRSAISGVQAARRIVAQSWALKNAGARRVIERHR
jgi:DNA-binding CsgD family transcriptional regulator